MAVALTVGAGYSTIAQSQVFKIIFIDQTISYNLKIPLQVVPPNAIEVVGGAEKDYVGGNENFVQQFARRHVDSFIDGLIRFLV